MCEQYLNLAYEQAKRALDMKEVPVGAVMIHAGKVIAESHNTKETEQNPVAHAEMNVMQRASQVLGTWRLTDCELYVTLEPCPMCLSTAVQARLKKIVYGAKDEKGGAICLGYHVHSDHRLNHQVEVELLENANCSQILKDFFLTRRNDKKSAKLKT